MASIIIWDHLRRSCLSLSRELVGLTDEGLSSGDIFEIAAATNFAPATGLHKEQSLAAAQQS